MGLLDGARSAVRYLGRTTGSLAADVGNAVSRTGEALAGAVTGSVSGPGTVRLRVSAGRAEDMDMRHAKNLLAGWIVCWQRSCWR